MQNAFYHCDISVLKLAQDKGRMKAQVSLYSFYCAIFMLHLLIETPACNFRNTNCRMLCKHDQITEPPLLLSPYL